MKNLEKILESSQLPPFLSEDWIDQAIKKLDRSKMTPEQRMFFEMTKAKQASIMEMLKEERKRDREEAILEGEAQGRLEGKREGKLEGKLEERKALAKEMMVNQISLEKISKITGFSIEEIKNL